MSDLFDQDFFAKLNRLKLAMHMRLDKGMSGARKSSAKGSSVEFSDFREYIPGDDIRRIDWNVYGRLDKLFIKQFMEEKEAFYHIFIDTSASMRYGDKPKSDMALRIAAVFVWLVQKQLDRVEILTYSGGRLAGTSPITGRGSFSRVLNELENISFDGQTRTNDAIRRANISGRGVSIIISDFLDPEGIDEAIKFLIYKKQEIMLLQVLSKEELEFDEEGTLTITDMETAEEVRVTMSSQTIKAYHRTLEEHNRQIEGLAKKYGCAYMQISSDDDIEKVVFDTFKQKGIFG